MTTVQTPVHQQIRFIFSNGIPVPTTYSLSKSVPANAEFTDTTYESKTASDGGTDVSLCTTGEKYAWNNKQSALNASQLAAVNSGIDSTKVGQIETNKNNILTIANQSTRYNVLNLSAAENVSASSGITYSILSDGSVHIEADINVTGSALYFEKIPITSNIQYITAGCPSGGGNTTYKVQIYDNETNIANADDTGSGSEPFTITTGKIGYRIRFAVGQYNIVVKPMVISKSLYDSGFTDYQPYAMSNAELTVKEQQNENNILLLEQQSKWHYTETRFTNTGTSSFENTGVSFTAPANQSIEFYAYDRKDSAYLDKILVCDSLTTIGTTTIVSANSIIDGFTDEQHWTLQTSGITPTYNTDVTYYIWIKRKSTGSNPIGLAWRYVSQ